MTSPARHQLYREATGAMRLGLAVNALLAVTKVVAGAITGSLALIADAVNSVGDCFTSLGVLVAFRIAQRPPDPEHPYGHSRAEGVAATNMALLVFLSALWVGIEAIRHLGVAQPVPPSWVLIVAGANFAIKESLFRYKRRVGMRTGSATVIANAWDHRGDALCSLAVLIGLSAVILGGESLFWADKAAALCVAVVVCSTAVMLFRRSASDLLDSQADDARVASVRAEAAAVAGVADIEKLFVRKSGLEYFVDIHVEVDGALPVREGHLIGHNVKDALLAKFGEIRDVLVHLEPHPHPPHDGGNA
ncbi:MAG: cation diffusion facilitator family transporter [Planctomycetota bacterium]